MKKTILISPIGNTDPIRNGYDGPLLHIARYYKPDKIYLILTNEMYKNHINDNRYVKCINQLYYGCKDVKEDGFYGGHKKVVEICALHIDVDNPSDFEELGALPKIIDNIFSENGNDCEYLLNITSSTQQMTSTLCVDLIYNKRNMKAVQVSTPENKSNKNIPHDDGAEDNCLVNIFDSYEKTATHRCKEAELTYLRRIFSCSEIKAFIEDYNYKYASNVLDRLSYIFGDSHLISCCKIGDDYLNSNLDTIKSKCKMINFAYNMTKDETLQDVLNAYNIMYIKEQKHLLSDFVCRLTPIFFLICKKIVNDIFDLNSVLDYKGLVLVNKLKESAVWGAFKERLPEKDFYLSSWSLIEIYKYLHKEDEALKLMLSIRNVEELVRNKVAHSVSNLNNSRYRELAKETPKETLNKIKQLIKIAYGENVKDDDFMFFSRLNERINNEIDALLNV